jgi:hypothetical protein
MVMRSRHAQYCPLKHCGHWIDSHSRHDCVYFEFVMLCVGSGFATD